MAQPKKASKQQQFQFMIEKMVRGGITYIEAICEYMEENQVEPHHVRKLISPILEEKLLVECTKANLLSKDCDTATLPL